VRDTQKTPGVFDYIAANFYAPVEVHVNTRPVSHIHQDVLGMPVSQADHVPDARPVRARRGEAVASFVPAVRITEVLDKPPVEHGRVGLEAQLFE